MSHVKLVVFAAVLASMVGGAATAQETGKRTAEQMKAALEAHKGDFDYLLGDWEFTATSQQYGRFRGLWSAVRLDEGQVLDEYRVVGDGGETHYVTTTLRNYNRAADRWELMGADAGAGLQKTWIKDFQQIEARRIGPARSLGPLAPARKPAAPAR